MRVSEIGFGAWAIGGDAWGPVEDAESLAAMERAIELGINFIDTADVYGDGRSESLVAQAIKGRRDEVVVSTKGGLMGAPSGCRARARLRPTGEDRRSVRGEPQAPGHRPRGRVLLPHLVGRARGDRGVHRGLRPAQEGRQGPCRLRLDAVQLDYSILNREPEKKILPYLEEREIGVVVRGPLRMGILTGKFTEETTFPKGDIRRDWPQERWFEESLKKVERLRPLEDGRTLGQLALRYVLCHPAVSVAIPGAKAPAQVEANAAASVGPLLSEEDLQLIREVSPL